MGDLTIFIVEGVDDDLYSGYEVCSLWFDQESADQAIEEYKAYDKKFRSWGSWCYRVYPLIVGRLNLS